MTANRDAPPPGAAVDRRPLRVLVLLALPALLLALAAIPLSGGSFGLQLGTLVVVYTLAVVGLDAVAGRGGLLHVGYAIVFGVGAYTVAVVAREVDAPAIVGIVLGMLLAGICSTALGLLLARSSGYLFAVLTLAASTALASIVNNVAWLGGTAGLGGVSRDLFGTGDLSPQALYVLVCVVTAVAICLYARFRRSATGRAIEALRLVPTVAQASGISVARLRVKLTALSGLLGGLAGALYALLQQYVSPDIVGATASVNLLAMNIIGGSTVALAGLPGAFITIGLPQLFQSLVSYQLVLVGVVTGAVALWFRRGVAGTLLDRWSEIVDPLFAARRAVEPEAEPPPARAVAAQGVPRADAVVLAATGVTVEFDGVVALSDISIALERGVVHAVVGPNGAGKSTLVGAITGSVPGARGSVRLHGRELSGLSAEQRARAGITRTFQLVALCDSLGVRENVMLGAHASARPSFVRDFFALHSRSRERATAARAQRLLELLGAGELAERRVGELTSGQQRLVEIARCLMTDADVILLDEPAAGLSANERVQLAQVIRDLAAEGRAVMLIEHDMEFVMSLAQRITVLARGMLLADGDPGEVRADPQVIEAYWGRPVAA